MAANPSIQLGTDGNWAIKENNLLAYKKDGTRFFNKEFDFSRATSATRVNRQGLIETVGVDEPRIDFLNNTKGHLLLEPSRSNLITYSQSVINGWISSNIVKVDNQDISPDGTFTSGHITSSSDSSFGSIRKAISVSVNSTYTISLFVKKEVSETYYMGVGFVFEGGTTDVGYGIIDAVNGTGYSADPRIPFTIKVDDYGTYWRFSFTGTDNGSNNSLTAYIYSTLSKNGTSVAVGLGSTRTIWGMQLEQGSYPTSIIKTQGSVVTRSAESCNDAGNSTVFNDSEGVLYAEIAALADDETFRLISISDGTTTNRVFIGYQNVSNNFYVLAGTAVAFISHTITDITKIAVKYKSGDTSIFINGIKAAVKTDTYTLNGLNSLQFDSGGGGSKFYGKVRNVQVFKRAMSDGELYLLTVPQYQSYQEMATALNYTL